MSDTGFLNVEGLCKRYSPGLPYAVSDISFSCGQGQIVAILGENGAGKSTTIKAVTGIHPFEKGKVTVCGYDIKTQPVQAKKCFGYVPDNHAVFEKMTGTDYVNFMADVYGVDEDTRKKRIGEFQDILKLGDKIDNIISSYSHGMKQKISIMGALIHNPKLLILDEPMVGLDAQTAFAVKQYMIYHKEKGNTVVFSSHNLDTVEKICDYCIIISGGRKKDAFSMEEFKEKHSCSLEEYFLGIISEQK